ncbi:MAG: sensor histidine kinase [Acidobacteria bacterium]|nr:MAG: sensor histidine kinase [Acidobacteriota bacterium]
MDHERTIAQQELINSLDWLIRLRWVAGAAVIALTFTVTAGLNLNVRALPFYLVGFAVAAYNLALRQILGALRQNHFSDTALEWFTRAEIGLDWIAMTILIHYSGGVSSPVIFFFVFHIIIASFLLPHDRGFLYVTFAPLLVAGVAFAEYHGQIPHIAIFEATLYRSPIYIAGVLFFFTSAAYVTAYFSMALSRRLRRREEEVTGLYESARATTSTLDLEQVLNRLTEATTRVLKCKAASIRLLNSTGTHLEMVAAHGLSQAYMSHASVPLASSVIDREALSGKTILISDAPNDERVRHREQVREEGIESILSTPLVGKQGLTGVLRAYGAAGHRFQEDDAEFLAAVAAQGSVAIGNARSYRILEDLNRQKSQFARMVTHELRSPIQVAQSLVNVLLSDYVGELNEKQRDLIQRAQCRLRHLQDLVDDLLNLAAAKADVLARPERSRVPLVEVLKDLYDRCEPRAKAKGIKLILRCADPCPEIWGREDELGTLFGNLLDNAIKYTDQGTACVSVRNEDGLIRVDVSDSGIGIPHLALSRVFDEFFRADNAKALEEHGTGLGLAIVKDLVARYEGKIDVQSHEGQGTTFTVWLPAAPGSTTRTKSRGEGA